VWAKEQLEEDEEEDEEVSMEEVKAVFLSRSK
jgi:hypothetical protein